MQIQKIDFSQDTETGVIENYFTKLFMVSHTGLIFIPYIDSLVKTLNHFQVYVRGTAYESYDTTNNL